MKIKLLNHRSALLILAIAVILSSLGLYFIQARLAQADDKSDIYSQLDVFGTVVEQIRNNYVDTVDNEKLIKAAINGMLSSLDAHSEYLDKAAYRRVKDLTNGGFGGVGIRVQGEQGGLKVVAPLDGTPGKKAGILSGDLIIEVDGKKIDREHMSADEAVDQIRGKPQTKVELTIIRKNIAEPLKFSVIREIIKNEVVKSKNYGNVVYIQLTEFNDSAFRDLKAGIAKAKAGFKKSGKKITGYILDLRNNPGGLLSQAVKISDIFIERGEIVSTKGRKAITLDRQDATPGDFTNGKPVIILINGGSASASEIVAGALQDHKRAIILGTRSFGKGSVQNIIPLNENSAIRLTIAKYYTPSGQSIQAKGITPDITIKQELSPELKEKIEKLGTNPFVSESQLEGHLQAEEGEEQAGSSSYVPEKAEDDQQLQAALKILNGEMDIKKAKKASENKAAKTNKDPDNKKPGDESDKKDSGIKNNDVETNKPDTKQ